MDDLDEPVYIVDYRAQWATQAVLEATRVAKAIGIAAADVEHVGSTAVVGLVEESPGILINYASLEFWSTNRSKPRLLEASPRPVSLRARNHVNTRPAVHRVRE